MMKKNNEVNFEAKLKIIYNAFPDLREKMKTYHSSFDFFNTENSLIPIEQKDLPNFPEYNKIHLFQQRITEVYDKYSNEKIREEEINKLLNFSDLVNFNIKSNENELLSLADSLNYGKSSKYDDEINELHQILKQQINEQSKETIKKLSKEYNDKRQKLLKTKTIQNKEWLEIELKDFDKFESSILYEKHKTSNPIWIFLFLLLISVIPFILILLNVLGVL